MDHSVNVELSCELDVHNNAPESAHIIASKLLRNKCRAVSSSCAALPQGSQ